jgi:Na+-transporting NADH:ubiquinone oxidoreductase subunit NqrA
LEFIIKVEPTNKNNENTNDDTELDQITYKHIMDSLIQTGLLQKVIQLPNSIEINSSEEEPIIRLCMKLLISIIFKG